MKTKSNKISKRVLLTAVTCLSLGVVIGASCVLISEDIKKVATTQQDYTVGELFAKAKSAVQEYPYATLLFNTVTHVGEEEQQTQYFITAERDTCNKSMEYGNTEQEEIIRSVWKETEEGLIDCYSYDENYEVWINFQLEGEPVAFELWDILKKPTGYKLLTENSITDEYGECYVMQATVTDDTYDMIVESILIDRETFLPKVVITQGITNTETDSSEVADGIEQEVQYYDEMVARYEFNYYKEPEHRFEIPTSFLTQEEYSNLLASEQESEVVEESSSEEKEIESDEEQ